MAAVRLVLDTNVVVSALLWRGAPFRLLRAIPQRDDARLFSSRVLIHELTEVLARPSPARRLSLIGRTSGEIVSDYVQAVDLAMPEATPRVVAADVDDDHVVAAAVAARADFIVSGDRHLLALEGHGAIRIVAPNDALKIVEAP